MHSVSAGRSAGRPRCARGPGALLALGRELRRHAREISVRPFGFLVPLSLRASPVVAFPFCPLLSVPRGHYVLACVMQVICPPPPPFFLIYFPFFLTVPSLAHIFEVSAPCAVRFLPPLEIPLSLLGRCPLCCFILHFFSVHCAPWGSQKGCWRGLRDFSPRPGDWEARRVEFTVSNLRCHQVPGACLTCVSLVLFILRSCFCARLRCSCYASFLLVRKVGPANLGQVWLLSGF